MGIKILAVGAILLGIHMLGVSVPALVTGIFLVLGGVGVLAGF